MTQEFHLSPERAFSTLAKITMLSQDPKHKQAFLLNYRAFVPDKIKLTDLWIQEYTSAKTKEAECEGVSGIIKIKHSKRIEKFLIIWTRYYPYDWDTKSLKSVLETLSKQKSSRITRKIKNNLWRHTNLRISPVESITAKLIVKAIRENQTNGITTKGRKLVAVSDSIDFLNLDSEWIARELTRIEWDIFFAIRPLELIFVVWKKERKAKMSPNITALIARFNKVSLWIGTEIVSTVKRKEKAYVLRKFIEIAWICLNRYNNFNTLMAILAGLNSSSIQRLKKSWKLISSKWLDRFREMESLMSALGNFKKYQERLDKCDFPKFPYLGKFLRDVTFIHDGNPKYHQNGSINFDRFLMILNQWEILHNFQRHGYQGTADMKRFDPTIYSFLHKFFYISEEDIYTFSLISQPLTNNLKHLQLSSMTTSSSNADSESELTSSTRSDINNYDSESNDL